MLNGRSAAGGLTLSRCRPTLPNDRFLEAVWALHASNRLVIGRGGPSLESRRLVCRRREDLPTDSSPPRRHAPTIDEPPRNHWNPAICGRGDSVSLSSLSSLL